MHDKRRALDFLNMLVVGETVLRKKGTWSNGPNAERKEILNDSLSGLASAAKCEVGPVPRELLQLLHGIPV